MHRLRPAVFLLLAVASLTPWASAPVALVAGLVFALVWGNPFPEQAKKASTWMLQASVVGLGAGANLLVVAKVGGFGLGQTLVAISVTLALALGLSRLLKTERTTSLLIGVGTAICGGSAIAAVAPVVGAKSHQVSVSLAVVFLLNAVALVLFPRLGHFAGLSPEAFGLWSALAIHDTSSVVGASMQFGGAALAVGTTVKLARALWIIPLTIVLGAAWKRDEGAVKSGQKPKRPWFILGFVAAAAVFSFVPGLAGAGQVVADLARHVLVATLFLIGAGVSRDALRAVGVRPLVLGVLLWVVVGSATLAAILGGVLTVPPLR
jgi:uncharacterized integral membrane protein (TIGR00698 family)